MLNADRLLKTNTKLSQEEIETIMQGNIYPCVTYQRIKQTIAETTDDLTKEA